MGTMIEEITITKCLKQLAEEPGFAFDIETTSESGEKSDNLDINRATVLCISFYSPNINFVWDVSAGFTEEEEQLITQILEDGDIKKVGHRLDFDMKMLAKLFDCKPTGYWFDTKIAARLLNERQESGLKDLAKKYLNREWGTYESEKDDYEKLKDYCLQDSRATFDLAEIFKTELQKDYKLSSLMQLEMQVLEVMTNAMIKGVAVDVKRLAYLKVRYERNTNKILRLFIEKFLKDQPEFNLNSTKQLTNFLYSKEYMNLPVTFTTPKGNPSTDAKTMERLAEDGHRVANYILSIRKWENLTTKVQTLLDHEFNGRLYPSFNIYGADTGRFTCALPNLQQVPRRGSGKSIRECFVGNLIVADYKNIELVILAHITQDPTLIRYFKEGVDMHGEVAKELGITRDKAKTFNFAILYGAGPKKIASTLKITVEDAIKLIDQWYAKFPKVKTWKKQVIAGCKVNGYVSSILGHRRHFPEIKFAKPGDRDAFLAELAAINHVIQGSSGDIIKLAISKLNNTGLVLQVHDELIFDLGKTIGTQDADRVLEIKNTMENVMRLLVPVRVDIHAVQNWGEKK